MTAGRIRVASPQWVRGSTNRKILSAAATIGLLTALVKWVVIGKELVIAATFGTGDALDAFLIAFLVPSFAAYAVAGSFNAALIPIYIQAREAEGHAAAGELCSEVMLWSLGLLALTTAVIVVAAPLWLPPLARGFSDEKLDLARRLLYVLSPLVLLTGMVTIWGAVLNAGERFALPALLPALTPMTVIVAVAVGSKVWGVFALAAGTTCGAALEAIGSAVAVKRHGLRLVPAWHGLTPNARRVLRQFVPMIAAAVLMGSTQVVSQAMAAWLPAGSVAALNYGSRIVNLPALLAAAALGTAVMPYFSGMVAARDWTGLQNTLTHYVRGAFLAMLPIAAVIFVFSEPITQILFERGAFTAQDTHLVAQVQALSSLQIPFYVAGIVTVRLIASMSANYLLTIGSLINLVVNVIMNYTLMKYLGVAGIALSTSIMLMISYLYVSACARRLLSERAQAAQSEASA